MGGNRIAVREGEGMSNNLPPLHVRNDGKLQGPPSVWIAMVYTKWYARTQLATVDGIHAGNGALNRVTELKRIKQGVSRLVFQNAYRGTRTSN